jgi:hypothetical protein
LIKLGSDGMDFSDVGDPSRNLFINFDFELDYEYDRGAGLAKLVKREEARWKNEILFLSFVRISRVI